MAEYSYSNKVVIFPNDDDGVSILVPAPDCGLSLEQIIGKDVPSNKPRQVLEITELPNDGTYRDAWTYEEV